MAITADEVEVRLQVASDNYVADLLKADKTFLTITKNMERNAVAAGAAFTRLGDFSVVAGNKVSGALAAADDTAARFTNNTANIAAQFQDIGVTAAAGMNPMIIALQQGTQLSAILNDSVGRGVSPVKALGAAFAQILNPISLGTIALVALGAAAIQYFSTLLSQGPASEEELKKQDDVLRDIAERWGDLVPAVKAYIDARDAAAEAKQTDEGFQDLIKRGWDDARAAAQKAGAEFQFAMGTLQGAGQGSTDAVIALNQEYGALLTSLQQGNATTEQAEKVNALLAQVIQESGIPAIAQYANLFQGLTAAIGAARAQQAAFAADQAAITDPQLPAAQAADYVKEQERINSLTREQLQLENEVNRVKAEASRDDVTLTDQQALQVATDRLDAEKRRQDLAAADKSGDKAAEQITKERDAVKELIADLEYEMSLIGASDEQKAVSNALREAGAEATDTQRERIEELTRALYEENEALDASKELYDAVKGASEQALKGFLHDIAEGKSAGEAFKGLLDDILSKLIDFGVSTALDAIFPGLGSLGTGKKRAAGGPVSGGSSYLVGEKGPEIFTPSSAGNITPNHMIGMGDGGGKVAISLDPGLRAAMLDESARQTVQIVQSQVPPMISQGAPQAAAQAQRNRTV